MKRNAIPRKLLSASPDPESFAPSIFEEQVHEPGLIVYLMQPIISD